MKKLRQSILAIEEDARARKVLSAGLTSHGFTVHSAEGASDGLKSFLSIKPDFVILNVSPLSHWGMITLMDICAADPHARVITVSTCTDGAYALECIRQGAADYVRKPFKLGDLTRSIERINNRRRMLKIVSEPDVECVKKEDKTLVFGNNTENLPLIVNQAVCNARVVCRDIDMLKTALGEIVLNAIEHGNLGITMKEKSSATEKGDYRKLLQEKMDDPCLASRVVTLQVHMTRDELVYTVADQGSGFDHEHIFDTEPHTRIGSGLGLFIARSFFTSITYKGNGSRVDLVYRRPAGERL